LPHSKKRRIENAKRTITDSERADVDDNSVSVLMLKSKREGSRLLLLV